MLVSRSIIHYLSEISNHAVISFISNHLHKIEIERKSKWNASTILNKINLVGKSVGFLVLFFGFRNQTRILYTVTSFKHNVFYLEIEL